MNIAFVSFWLCVIALVLLAHNEWRARGLWRTLLYLGASILLMGMFCSFWIIFITVLVFLK